ncbi:AMP-binding protein [Sneathiella chinensis]|uniref:AMP-binding protein n=1 Tax=Sneathiella chinensis TaxID=349750 RepID=UPI00146B7E08|nr:AMP-binding protein [Sneathiella chinensis]
MNRPVPDISVNKRKDGSYLIESNIAIGDYEKNVAVYWRRAAEELPDRPFLVQCQPAADWPELTYAEARDQADRVSTWLLQQGYGPDTPLLILSGNSLAHAVLSMGAIQIGVPIVPVSPSFSLMTGDYSKLKYAAELVGARMIFAESGDVYGKAIQTILKPGMDVVTVGGEAHGGLRFQDMLAGMDAALVAEAYDKVDRLSLAKILFTSGSTGMPKAVPNTQGMICSALKMHELIGEPRDPINNPMITLDWLPWHHTYGGNVNFFGTMRLAGTLYMDDGKPMPGMFQRTIDNIRRVRPTRFSSVPMAFSFLLDELEADEILAEAFFDRLNVCNYGGAALSQELYERTQVLSIRHTGYRMPFGTGWGSTETVGTGTAVYWNTEKVGLIGVPYSGVQVKLVPVADKYEIRIRGPHVHDGYYKRPDLTDQYFDDEGFYCIGDAVSFEDPDSPEKGLRFSGRVSEDFKLSNGTWVNMGALRLSIIDALDPLVRDVVITGHDREALGILIVPAEGLLKRSGLPDVARSDVTAVIKDASILDEIRSRLETYNRRNPSKSRWVGHALVMAAPLSVDRNEITDKQYINQNAVLENRAELVRRLYEDTASDQILTFNE